MAQPPYDNRTDAEKAKAIAEQGLPGQEWTGFQQDRMGPMPNPAMTAQQGLATSQQPTMQQPAPPVDPGSMVQGQQQSFDRQTGGGLSVDVQAPGHRARFGQGEFYSGPERPFETRSTQVGRYGGAPIVLPYTGQAPMSVLAERQAQINRDKAALEQQKQQWDPYADFKEVIPAAYQKSWQRAINSSVDTQLEQTIAMFDGDEMAAYDAIRNPMSPEGRAWRRMVNDVNTTTNQVNENYGRALAYIEGAEANAIVSDPELLKRAQNLIGGLDGFDGDWAKLGEKAEAYGMMQSFDSYVKEFDVEGRLHKAFAETPGEPEVTRQNGLYIVTSQQKRDFESAVDAEAEHIAKIYNGRGGMTKAVIRDYLMRKFPMQVEQKVQAIKPNAPKGSGKKGDGTNEAGYSARLGTKPSGRTAGPNTPAAGVEQMSIFPEEKIGGRLQPIAKMDAYDWEGNTHQIHAPDITYNQTINEWRIEGRSLNETETQKMQSELEGAKDAAETKEIIDRYKRLGKPVWFKADDNRIWMERVLGYRDPNEYVAAQLAASGVTGVTAEKVAEAMKDPAKRKALMSRVR